MFENLEIFNFKSIKHIQLNCKRVNVFIGEPNSGKSNIIEALSLQSQRAVNSEGLNRNIFRFKNIGDLFYDYNVSEKIEIRSNIRNSQLIYSFNNGNPSNSFDLYFDDLSLKNKKPIKLSHNGSIIQNEFENLFTSIKYYEFPKTATFSPGYTKNLESPFGQNLPNLLYTNSELKEWVESFLKSKDLILSIDPVENEISACKFQENILVAFKYANVSETLRRVIFYYCVAKSNKGNTILLDEPETNTFPSYTKLIAETIADNLENQYFITTHNPYLLDNLIQKTDKKDLNIYLTTMKDFKTMLFELTESQIAKVIDFNSDVFFNFDNLLEDVSH